MTEMTVDVVYTWVNSADPGWVELYSNAVSASDQGSFSHESSNDIARFQNRDELLYSIKSIRKYAAWVRNIYIVTNCSLPSSIQHEKSIFEISHEDIFLDSSVLPTFNSHAIEASLHRIAGLSERFLYFNDDVFLCNAVFPSNFYSKDGKPYIFQSKHAIPAASSSDLRPVDYAALNASDLIEADFGFRPTQKLHHAPFPLLRSTLYEMEGIYKTQLQNTASHKFRDNGDIPLATTFHAYYSLAKGYAEIKDIKSRYIDIGDPLFVLLIHPLSPLRRGKYQTFCLNEVKHIRHLGYLRDYIVERFLIAMFDE